MNAHARLGLIVARSGNGVIGRNGGLPWHLPADLARFKTITMGKTLLMGRRTYVSIGRPLPGRHNVVLTRQRGFEAPGCEIVHSFERALARIGAGTEAFVIGGAALYRQALDRVGCIYLTEVHAHCTGDSRFPALDAAIWREIERQERPADKRNPYRLSFVVLERRSVGGETG